MGLPGVFQTRHSGFVLVHGSGWERLQPVWMGDGLLAFPTQCSSGTVLICCSTYVYVRWVSTALRSGKLLFVHFVLCNGQH